jgi:coatomer subunit beta
VDKKKRFFYITYTTEGERMSTAVGSGGGGGGGPPCYLLLGSENEASRGGVSNQREQQELQKELESSNALVKIAAMKKVLKLVTNGVQLPNLVMTVIRYCMMTDNHELKKLLHLYWESVPKTQEDGVTLRPEMVLVVNSILSDLNHANEYVRGCTLRMLCRVQEPGLMSHLIEPIKANLSYRHAYVRRQAALCMAMVKRRFGEEMIPDIDELLEQKLEAETDGPTRRDMFLALSMIDPERALKFFSEHAEQAPKFGEGYCLSVLELARRTCKADPNKKARFIKTLFQLLQSESPAVVFEASWTLMTLSSAPTAVRAVAAAYCHILHIDSDNSTKLLVLEKLSSLEKAHPKLVQESLMDVLRALSSPNPDIRRKTLAIAMDLVTPQNVDEVVLLLKKEVVKTQAKDVDRDEANEYRKMLIQAIHTCAVKFPAIAASVVHVLMDFLNGEGSIDVILFVREIAETQPAMRNDVISKLVDGLSDIRASNVARGAYWILGEYAQGEVIEAAFKAIQESLGPLPFITEEQEAIAAGTAAPPVETGKRSNLEIQTTVTVLPDGTYATQTALTEANRAVDEEDQGPAVRKLILDGDWFLGSVAIVALTKLALKKYKSDGESSLGAKELGLNTLLTACSMIKAGESKGVKTRMDMDSKDRIDVCIRVLLDPSTRHSLESLLLGETRTIFTQMVQHKRAEAERSKREAESKIKALPFELIAFRQLRGRSALGNTDEPDDDVAFSQAVKGKASESGGSNRKFVSRTNNRVNVYTSSSDSTAGGGADDGAGKKTDQWTHKNIHALTGSTDPVYVEATVVVHDFDIVIDFLIINRTEQTLTNVEVELFIVGDLKLTDRHQPFTMGPRDQRSLVTNIKVSSTETGHVFGNISFDHPQQLTTNIVSLQEIYIDIMNYIKPATCTDSEFRSMWAEFEWENKVAVFTVIPDCRKFLNHIQHLTNMTCLTPVTEFINDGGEDFLAANLFATSVFGEAALLNLSIEKSAITGKIEGFIRIRAKNQGIALSLGDRITMKQKGTEEAPKRT